jgi:ribose transport system permease protein
VDVSERRGLRARITGSNMLGVIVAADLVLVLVSQFGLGTNLLHRASLSTVTPLLGVLILVSLAQGVVIGTGGIDLSIPATITLTGSIVLKASGGTDAGLGRAIVITAAACVVIGLVNGTLVEVFRLNALVVTLATGQLITGITELYQGPVLATSNVPAALASLAARNAGGVSIILFVAAACAALLALGLSITVPGRRLVAASASGSAAILAGLAAGRLRIAAWVVATLVCGLGAVLLAGQVVTPDLTLGSRYLLSTVVVVVLGGAVLSGGRVSPAGIVAGAVFLTVLDQDLQVRDYSTAVSQIAQGVVLALGLAALGYARGWRLGRPGLRRS